MHRFNLIDLDMFFTGLLLLSTFNDRVFNRPFKLNCGWTQT